MLNELPKESRKEKDLDWCKRAMETELNRAGASEDLKSDHIKFLLMEVVSYEKISDERKQRLLNILIAEYARDMLTYEEVVYIRESLIKNIDKEEMARELGRSRRTVYRHIEKYHMNILTKYQRAVQKIIRKLRQGVNDGKSFKEIAIELGISQRTLYKYNKKYDLGLRPEKKTKIEKRRDSVKKLYINKTDPKVIAEKMGVSLPTIYRDLEGVR